jgi:hypothetical protein
MNDLTFGTTLLAFFATLIIVILEPASAPAQTGAGSAVARTNPPPMQIARANARDCTTIVLPPTAAR